MADKAKQTTNRVGYMIFSIAAAIFIWAGIAYTDDQNITKTFHNANIRINGENELKNSKLVVTDVDKSKISYEMTGKRSELISSMDGITLEVDVSDISEPGIYNLEYSLKEVNPRLEVDVSFKTVTVEVGTYAEKEIPIEIRQLGLPKDKLVKSETDTESVVIAGSAEEIENVSKGIVSIDVSDIDETSEYMVKYIMVDNNGNMLTKNNTIESKVSELKVTNTVYNLRTLPVNIVLSDDLSKEYTIEENVTTVTPHSITVGVQNGYEYDGISVKITSIEGNSFKYELVEKEGMYIPINEDDIKINLKVMLKEDEL